MNIKAQIAKLIEGMPPGDRMRVLKFCQTISAMRTGKKAARASGHQRRSPELNDWKIGN